MSCIVRGCRSHSGKIENSTGNISFHKFPKIEDVRRQWFTATDRNETQHKSHWRVCSRHFVPEHFVGGNLMRVRLKENAVPILNLPNKTACAFTHPSLNVKQQRNTRTGLTVTMTVNQRRLRAIYEERINKLKKRIQKLELIAKNRLLKLNAQKQRTRRLIKKYSTISQRFFALLDKEKTDEE